MLITRTHGSWVVLGTLVTEAELDATLPVHAGCGSCTRCIDACPTDALDEPGVLDATRCLSYWTQTAGELPEDVMEALGDRVYGCDICQDVCPWNAGVEKRRAGAPLEANAEPTVSLADWLTRRTGSSSTNSTGCTSLATTPAGFAGTRSSRSGTSARRETLRSWRPSWTTTIRF